MLPSPIIEGTLPAFYYSEQDGGAIIKVPFVMSRAVNKSEVQGFRLKMKHIQGGDILVTLDAHSIDLNNCVVEFKLHKDTLVKKNFIEGSFYKAQLAYCYKEAGKSELGTGYFSTVGIIKYTTKPEVSILGLKKSFNNAHQYEYTGVYSQFGKDVTEKEYSYRFEVKDPEGNVIADTGFLIHNNSTDIDHYESKDTFLFSQDLDENKKYTILYTVRTNNGLEEPSPNYKIMAKKAVVSTLSAKINTVLNYNNGYISLTLDGDKNELGFEKAVKGSFILARSSEESNYTQWEELDKFVLAFERPSTKSWKDFTIEQGINYQYSIQQYNSENLYSERILSDIIYADFEDSFLYDGERQLKIKFNPKVTSFKKDLLEAKIDTIGSKYPFIFRNGNVEYKEFPISGLISYLMDDEFLFLRNEDMYSSQERNEVHRFERVYFPTNVISTIRENTYKKNYLFYYFYDSKNKEYIRWVNYLKTLVDKKFPNPKNRVYDWYNWRRWEEEFKKVEGMLYLNSRIRTNLFNVDKRNLKTTNEVSYNIQTERDFKLEVLEWLTNGKPKLFKSPNEGNYLVRLMNTSLSPNDQVGRMLHTFTSTAYEVADVSYESLVQYNIINVTNLESRKYLKVVTIPLSTTDENYVKLNTHIKYTKADNGVYYASGPLLAVGQTTEWLEITDMAPGDKIMINGSSIIIGNTGHYEAPIPVEQIIIPDDIQRDGLITFGYYGALNDTFSQIIGTDIREVIGEQYIGEYDDILPMLEDSVKKVTTFYDIKVHKRPQMDLYIKEDKLYDYSNNEIATLSSDDQINLNNFDYFNPLITYQYTKTNSDLLDDGLYCKVEFAETEKMDQGKKPLPSYKYDDFAARGYERMRHTDVRTVTNPYLMNIRDFNMFVRTKQLYIYEDGFKVYEDSIFDGNKEYYIKENIEFIVDPAHTEQRYVSLHSYNKFIDMYNNTNQSSANFKAIFKPYLCKAYINSRDFDVTDIENFSTGNIGKIDSLQTTVGVYCELFYQEQIVDYDISKSALVKEKKATVDLYREKLQQDYMIERCIEDGQRSAYIDELNTIYADYDRAYNEYLQALDAYLELIEQEG